MQYYINIAQLSSEVIYKYQVVMIRYDANSFILSLTTIQTLQQNNFWGFSLSDSLVLRLIT